MRRLVLVGAGHAHAIVLDRWATRPPPDARLTVVTDREELLYSGMIPGLLAGEYERDDLVIDAGELARRAGARLVIGSVTSVDAERRRLTVELDGTPGSGPDDFAIEWGSDDFAIEGGSDDFAIEGEGPHAGGTAGDPLRYDVASLDVGSTLEGLAVPGVREHAVGARSADALARGLDDVSARGSEASVVVVGGGAAGVELAAVSRARARSRVTLVEGGDRVMSGRAASVSARVRRALGRRGVEVRLGATVARVDADAVLLESGERLAADLTIWATGAAAHPFLRRSGLPVDPDGFVEVDADLRVRGRDDLFAAGDCASLPDRSVPKAGVHAVRQGPVLAENLVAVVEALSGRLAAPSLRPYRPQRDVLTLLNLGDGRALGTKWGIAVEGRWVRWVKDVIDRRFLKRFTRRLDTRPP